MTTTVQALVAEKKAGAPAKSKLTNAERFPTAAKQKAEAEARKAEAAKAKTEGKPVPKPAKAKAEQVPFVNRTVKKDATLFLIAAGARPSNGRLLFAHTHAALALFGMFADKSPAVPKSAVIAFLGQTAVSYHLSENNFADGPDHTLKMTAAGRGKFLSRMTAGKFDTKVAMAFQDLFLTGKVDPSTGVNKASVYPQRF